MNARQKLLATFEFSSSVPPPRYERQFSEEAIQAWRKQGLPEDGSPETYFELDRREDLPVHWRRNRTEKRVVRNEADLASFRQGYDPADPERLPEDWTVRKEKWRNREVPLEASPWCEGFFQVIGIRDGASLVEALLMLNDNPSLVEAQMEHYTWFLEELLDRVLPGLEVDYAVCYVPIASNHGPVISPDMYRRFSLPFLRRVSERLERHGVRYRFVYSSGAVGRIIPIWLDAGINGLLLSHPSQCGLPYGRLRRDYDKHLRFFGGVDWRSLVRGREAIREELERNTRPLLEQGGYVPHLDDTVREYVPFDSFRYYRERLDDLVSQVFGCV